MEKLTEKKFWEALKEIEDTEKAIIFYQKGIEIGCIDGNDADFLDEDTYFNTYFIEDLGEGIFRIECFDMSLFADSYKIYEP